MEEYSSFEQIENDLRVLKLKRQIAVQELKNLKTVAKSSFDPTEWISPIFWQTTSKFGLMLLLKKLFK